MSTAILDPAIPSQSTVVPDAQGASSNNEVAGTEDRAPRRFARYYYLATAVISLSSIVLTIILAIHYPTATVVPNPATASAAMIVGQVLSYFTVLSNILVSIVSLMLFRNPDRTGKVFRVVHLDALLMISVTGLIFGLILAAITHPVGIAAILANAGLHYVVPPMFVLGWALFGPRPTFSIKLIAQALIIPIAWVVYTLIHGAIISWYPYPFLNVMVLGYGTVALNIVGIALLAVVLAAIFLSVGSLIKRRRHAAAIARPASA